MQDREDEERRRETERESAPTPRPPPSVLGNFLASVVFGIRTGVPQRNFKFWSSVVTTWYMMSCYMCSKKFKPLLTREHTCSVCHFSFCGKCISTAQLGTPKEMCKCCIGNASTKKNNGLNNWSPKNTLPAGNSQVVKDKQGKSEQEIAERLRRLQESSCQLPSDDELQMRLRKLKDVESTSSSSPAFLEGKKKTSEEETVDLLKQVMDEVKLEEKSHDCDRSIERRLQELKKHPLPVSPRQQNISAGSEFERPNASAGEAEEDEAPLPWCVLCNEDAAVVCHGCDGDLYCRSCFKEFHHPSDPEPHKHSPYLHAEKN
ncbi:unnamed protein product [Darwinula stevensoni]|uniref:FYVE-type domain-containing protein n=1 Tax=Darwinula stevensoni TaxID=69355 RepID=A0A7R8X1C7_9CRUS|nr:unnamed protein product [Darwinula stevensoni]CAG0880098.1 unnamed protein product [Darwinula stevensoni]